MCCQNSLDCDNLLPSVTSGLPPESATCHQAGCRVQSATNFLTMIYTVLREIRTNRIIISLMFLRLATSALQPARGRSDTALASPDEPAVAASAMESDVRFSVESDSRFGILTYVPEQWGELSELAGTAIEECQRLQGCLNALQKTFKVTHAESVNLLLCSPVFNGS